MQRLEVSCAVRPIYMSLGVKRLINITVSKFFKLCLGTQKFVAFAVSVEDLFWNKKCYFK